MSEVILDAAAEFDECDNITDISRVHTLLIIKTNMM